MGQREVLTVHAFSRPLMMEALLGSFLKKRVSVVLQSRKEYQLLQKRDS